jgi:NAD(P)-dependent dehydrogenase (short-subunit alcohol dehydrogenase family)
MENKRIALVTGANKGIGLEIARQLAEAGVHVIIGARNAARARTAVNDLVAKKLVAQSVPIDLDDLDTVATAAARIRSEHGKLDILVNNAGIFDFADGPPSQASIAAVRRTIEVNFIGALAVTQAMLPLLKEAPLAAL